MNEVMIDYYQQGGDIDAQLEALADAALSGNKEAVEQINKLVEAAKGGDEQAAALVGKLQKILKRKQGGAAKAQDGEKLAYIHFLNTGADPDEEVVYERRGGCLRKKVVKKCKGARMRPFREQGGPVYYNYF